LLFYHNLETNLEPNFVCIIARLCRFVHRVLAYFKSCLRLWKRKCSHRLV